MSIFVASATMCLVAFWAVPSIARAFVDVDGIRDTRTSNCDGDGIPEGDGVQYRIGR